MKAKELRNLLTQYGFHEGYRPRSSSFFGAKSHTYNSGRKQISHSRTYETSNGDKVEFYGKFHIKVYTLKQTGGVSHIKDNFRKYLEKNISDLTKDELLEAIYKNTLSNEIKDKLKGTIRNIKLKELGV